MRTVSGLPPVFSPLCDMSGLDTTQTGALYLLLGYAVYHDGRISSDPKHLAFKVRQSPARWAKMAPAVLKFFEPSADGKWLYPKCDLLGRPNDGVPRRESDVSHRQWVRLRAVVFKRDNYTCQYCGTIDGPFDCDHVVPVALGGRSEPGNLATACAPCNREKGDRTLEQWKGVPA